MKIALIGPAHPLRGGLATYNERLAGFLQEQGHTVTIYSFSLQYPSFLFPGTTQYTDEPAPQHLTIRTIINSVNPLNWLKAGKEIKSARYDLIIVRYWLPFMGPALGTILRIVKGNKHTRIVAITDNVIPHEKRPGDVTFTKYFLKPVDAFITMSREVLQDLQMLTTKPAQYTPHPVYDNFGEAVDEEVARQKLGLKKDGKYVLFFGFIRKYKGLDILLEAMNDARIKAAGIELIVAGEFYTDRDEYDAQIQQLQLKDRVHLYTEFIPNGEVPIYFGAADVVAQPYRSATQSGITLVAYQLNKPVITSNVGGLPEIVPDGKTGFVAEPNPTSIADAILRYYTPGSLPDLYASLQHEKEKYTWDTFVERLFGVVGIE